MCRERDEVERQGAAGSLLALSQGVSSPFPSLSIVVASTGDRRRLLADLAAAAPQCARDEVELIVVRGDSPSGLVELGGSVPNARFIGAPPTTDLATLRGLGFAAASGDVVTLLDHSDRQSITHERWLQELRRRCSLHRSRRAASETGSDGASLPHPYLSVIVPVHQGARVLPESLAALAQSELPRALWELIVVDDASTDNTALTAARFADVVIRLPGRPHGTAYARNRGFELARGECVAFVNADVCVHPDTLTRFTLVLAREPDVTAVFGSFDPCRDARGFVSHYRSLLLRYYHQETCESAETFCASCGAVRSAAFAHVGMFDEWHFPRHQVEDFELGHRLRQNGHRIVMRPDIRAAHLKCWTLRGMITADLYDRVVPWMRLFDRRAVPREKTSEKPWGATTINTVLTWGALVLGAYGIHAGRPLLFVASTACTAVVLRNTFARYRFFARHRGLAFAVAAFPLDLLSYLVNGVAVVSGWLMRQLLGEPKPHPTIEAFAEIGVRTWPPIPSPRIARVPPAAPQPATLERPA